MKGSFRFLKNLVSALCFQHPDVGGLTRRTPHQLMTTILGESVVMNQMKVPYKLYKNCKVKIKSIDTFVTILEENYFKIFSFQIVLASIRATVSQLIKPRDPIFFARQYISKYRNTYTRWGGQVVLTDKKKL